MQEYYPDYSYYIVFSIIALFSFIDIARYDSSLRHLYYLIISLILILFAGLRPNSADYSTYVNYFYLAKNNILEFSGDIGYILLNVIISKIFDTPLPIFLIMAVSSVTMNLKCYKQYTRYSFLAILYYFVFTYIFREMAQIRSGLSCAICLYNIRNITTHKKFKFLFFQIIATSMHLASIIFLIVPFIKKIKLSREKLFFILGICLIIGIFFPLGVMITSLLPLNKYTNRILAYLNSSYNYKTGILTNPTLLKQLSLCLILLLFYDTVKDKIKHYDLLLKMYIAGTCWYMLFQDFAIFAARLATFLTIGEPILVASLLYLAHSYSRPVLYFILVGCALIYLMLALIRLSGVIFKLAF
jgi:hypothetical protein